MINYIKDFKWHLIFLFLLCTVGPLSFKWGPVPFSFQSFFILISPFVFKRKDAVSLILIYLFLGAIGVPVFAGYTGGIEKLYGPTSGFLWGFIPVVFILSLFKESESLFRVFILLLLGHLLLFIPGFLVLKFQKPEIELLDLFIWFVPGIIIKSGIGDMVVMGLKKRN
ncbi:MAG: biotin transporter BioY [Bacteroidetes bacterium]|nr:MAG: biotin transporter BioY [Bacteroidota bacterium]